MMKPNHPPQFLRGLPLQIRLFSKKSSLFPKATLHTLFSVGRSERIFPRFSHGNSSNVWVAKWQSCSDPCGQPPRRDPTYPGSQLFNSSLDEDSLSPLTSCLIEELTLTKRIHLSEHKAQPRFRKNSLKGGFFFEEYNLLTKGIESPPSLQLTSWTCPAAVRPHVLVEPRHHQPSNPVVLLKLQTRDSLAIGQETGVRTNMKAPHVPLFSKGSAPQ